MTERKWAILDRTGLLVELRQSARKPRGPCVDVTETGCDLKLRRYRWTGGTFVPLSAEEAVLGGDTGDRHAIALGFASLHNAGLVTFHGETVAWLERYAKSVDNKVDPDKRVVLTR